MKSLGAAMMIPLLFYNRLVLSGASFLADQIVSNDGETVLERFFAEYKVQMEKAAVRDMVVLAASTEQLRRREPLLEDFPHSFGTDAAILCGAEWITLSTLVVLFLDNLEERRLKRRFKDLSRCKTHQFHVIFESSSAMNVADVDTVVQIFVKEVRFFPLFIHHNDKDDSVKVYGHVMGKHGSTRTILITNWQPGGDIIKANVLVEPPPIAACSLNVATVHNPPWMVLDERATGGAKIKGGFEGNIILEFARNFNYTVTVQNPKSSADDKRHSSEAIISSCAAGRSNIGIGRIRLTKSVTSRVVASYAYIQECVVWCVPRIVGVKTDPLFSEFSWTVWLPIGIMFLGSFAVEWLVRNRLHPDRGVVGHRNWVRIILDIVGVTLGSPIVHRPISIGGKALLIVYICYSTVMTTAYKTSLSSLLTAGNLKSTIVDVAGIIEANLTTGGDAMGLAVLEDQRNESEWGPELIKRYVIETNISKALRRVSKDQDFAFLVSVLDLTFHKRMFKKYGEKIRFDVLDDCVSIHSLVAVFARGDTLHLFNDFHRSLKTSTDNGLIDFWKRNEFKKEMKSNFLTKKMGMVSSEEELRSITRTSIIYILTIHGAVMAFSILVFLGELILHKYRSIRRNRRLDNLNLFKITRRPPLRSASRRSD